MNRQRSGFGLYAAFMVIIVLAMFYITGKISAGSSPMTSCQYGRRRRFNRNDMNIRIMFF